MSNDAIVAITLLSCFLIFVGFLAYGIYSIHKKCKQEDDYREQEKFVAQEKLKIEMTKPKYQIRFVDSDRLQHISKTFEPYITSNRFMTNEGEYYSIISSERVAGFALKEAYKKGYIRDDKGVTYPTCNLVKVFVEER